MIDSVVIGEEAYGIYVLLSFGFTVGIMSGLIGWLVFQHRILIRKLQLLNKNHLIDSEKVKDEK